MWLLAVRDFPTAEKTKTKEHHMSTIRPAIQLAAAFTVGLIVSETAKKALVKRAGAALIKAGS